MQTFIKKYLNFYGFYVFLFFTSLLVFFSRYLQIVFVKKNEEQFYLFEDPIFINPDAYFYLKGSLSLTGLKSLFFFAQGLLKNN